MSVSVIKAGEVMTACQRRRMEVIKRCATRRAMFYHSGCSVVRSCGSVWGVWGVWGGGFTRRPR